MEHEDGRESEVDIAAYAAPGEDVGARRAALERRWAARAGEETRAVYAQALPELKARWAGEPLDDARMAEHVHARSAAGATATTIAAEVAAAGMLAAAQGFGRPRGPRTRAALGAARGEATAAIETVDAGPLLASCGPRSGRRGLAVRLTAEIGLWSEDLARLGWSDLHGNEMAGTVAIEVDGRLVTPSATTVALIKAARREAGDGERVLGGWSADRIAAEVGAAAETAGTAAGSGRLAQAARDAREAALPPLVIGHGEDAPGTGRGHPWIPVDPRARSWPGPIAECWERMGREGWERVYLHHAVDPIHPAQAGMTSELVSVRDPQGLLRWGGEEVADAAALAERVEACRAGGGAAVVMGVVRHKATVEAYHRIDPPPERAAGGREPETAFALLMDRERAAAHGIETDLLDDVVACDAMEMRQWLQGELLNAVHVAVRGRGTATEAEREIEALYDVGTDGGQGDAALIDAVVGEVAGCAWRRVKPAMERD